MDKRVALGLTLATASLAPGCVIEGGVSAVPGAVAVSTPPPPPVVEVRPLARDPQAVWIAGYWHWTGMQYTWIPGHWELAPAGARWRGPHYWIREGTYFYQPGGWMSR
jgi:hypothetical protein